MWLMKAGRSDESYRFAAWTRGGYCAVGFREVQDEIPEGVPDDRTGKEHIREIVARWLPAADVKGTTLSLFNFCARMRPDDLVVVWREGNPGLLHFGTVTGPLISGGGTAADDYARRREVRWLGTQPCPPDLRGSVARQHPTVEIQERNASVFRSLANACAAPAAEPRAEAVQVKAGRLTLIPYADQDTEIVVTQAVLSTPDAAKMTWAVREHRKLLRGLANEVEGRGLRVWLGMDDNHVYDILWSGNGELTLCEVKSLTEENETDQLRTAIGQLLDYADDFRPKRLARLAGTELGVTASTPLRRALWVSHPPKRAKHWSRICASAGITLAWPGQEDKVLPKAAQ
ncbi:hypothetical protein ACIRU3_44570 [Streptomyces sp. NPDC101151]|uniref:hypothetical protein n=1 Tax=Streptomyces sp. NPDC101151 TaxID=3366115 RepID=UPI00380FB36E